MTTLYESERPNSGTPVQAILMVGNRRRKGLILAANANRMRVVLEERGDVLELRALGSDWQTERGVRVEIEALAPVRERAGVALGVVRDFSLRHVRPAPRALVAGSWVD